MNINATSVLSSVVTAAAVPNTHTDTNTLYLISMQVEDEHCCIMLMSIYAVQSHASLTEEGKSRENNEVKGEKRMIKGKAESRWMTGEPMRAMELMLLFCKVLYIKIFFKNPSHGVVQ